MSICEDPGVGSENIVSMYGRNVQGSRDHVSAQYAVAVLQYDGRVKMVNEPMSSVPWEGASLHIMVAGNRLAGRVRTGGGKRRHVRLD